VVSSVIILLALRHGLWAGKSTKLSPLERGFHSFFQDFSVFRTQFFLFLILFIIFDVEVVLLSFFFGGLFRTSIFFFCYLLC